jgi:SAM-dependent methyltransferase
MMDAVTHWNETYTTKAENQVSWFQARPDRSLAFIESAPPNRKASIVDIGGGASRLIDALLAEGYADLTVLDISAAALDRSKTRVGARAKEVFWIVANITEWRPLRVWDVWHDRAVFHFLTDAAGQDAYINALKHGTAPGSTVILATFALTGPERCSGLPVQRYSPETLAARLGADFALSAQAAETHATPFGSTQDFTYAVFKRL